MEITQVRSSKVPEVTLGFWIVKIIATTLGETAGDAVSMTMQLGYAVEQHHLYRHLSRRGQRANRCQVVSSLPLLGGHRCHHDCRHDHGRFCRSVTGDWLRWWCRNSICTSHGVSFGVVPYRRLYLGHQHHVSEGRTLLLDHNFVLTNLGHGTRRLGGRYQRSGIRRRSAGFRRRPGVGRCGLLLYK